jgi:erythromycin esterase
LPSCRQLSIFDLQMASRFLTLYFLVCFSVAILPATAGDLPAHIRSVARTLDSASDLEDLVAKAGDRRLVLLGEASHGTHEYYAWRDSISRQLISRKGFRFIAVEGDWASLFELNRYVKHIKGAASSAREVLEGLSRWPRWMWANEEVVALAEWLREYNDVLPMEQRVGFYGMDVYDEWNAKEVLLEFLREDHPALYAEAEALLDCFTFARGDSWAYGSSAAMGQANCADQTRELLQLMESGHPDLASLSDYERLYLSQNALVIKNAEKFFRKSVASRDASSWNSRARHMHLTVERLMAFYGEDSRGIVWAHNTHIGDARFTEMQQAGQENIGQLARLSLGADQVMLVGFATYTGRVLAGDSWEGRRRTMRVPRAVKGSIERVFHESGLERFYLLFDEEDRSHDGFMEPTGNRAIGVVYDPRNDSRQYITSIVPLRYDAVLYFRETKALHPLHP